MRRSRMLGRKRATASLVLAAAVVAAGLTAGVGAASGHASHRARKADVTSTTATPIKHLVVIYQENVSFDHYFGTYPNATNPSGEPAFRPAPGTPSVNGLSAALLTNNPNLGNPQRLDRSQAHTCDQGHGYTQEQQAFDMGLMDKFVQTTGGGKTLAQCLGTTPDTPNNYAVMDYYDGNTVTGLWNYAQSFAMSDNSYSTGFGPSSPGAINVTAGNTYGVVCGPSGSNYNTTPCTGTIGTLPSSPQGQGTGTMVGDPDPYYDVCSHTQDSKAAADTDQVGGTNVGDLLNSKDITWGWFQGGFASPNYTPGNTSSDELSAVCTGSHTNINGASIKDYSPHHEPFQYYASTANPQHEPPTSIAKIGYSDQANHQYDLKDFWAAADSGNMPAVSYLKAAEYQDGHAGYSNPLDEQTFLAQTINHLERLPSWNNTAVVIAYDDSDGWYDHQLGPIVTQSQTSLDALTGTGQCGDNSAKVPMTDGTPPQPEQARCGVGPRQPLLVISPYSKPNYVDSSFTTQTSVVRFIEDNWLGGERIGGGSTDATSGTLGNMLDFGEPHAGRLYLDPSTGEPVSQDQGDTHGQGQGGG